MSQISETMTLDELLQLLECPVCLQVSDIEKYFQCKNGHFGCHECYSRLSECPVCKISLTSKAKTIAQETMLVFQNNLRHVEDFEGKVNLKYLLEMLKCFRCRIKPTRRPIWQCQNGHIICDDCFSTLLFPCCDICKSYYLSPQYRSLIAETWLSFLDKPCRFSNHGCKVMIRDLSDHEKEDCIYREVKCIFINCYEKVTIAKLKEHLEEDKKYHHSLSAPLESNLGEVQHKMEAYLNLPTNFNGNINIAWHKISFLKLDNIYNFIPVCWAGKFHGNYVFWVYYLGLPKEIKKFAFKLRLFSLQCSKEITVTYPITPIYTPYFEMFRHPAAFKIPFGEVKEHWGQAVHSLKWEVEVFQK